MSVIDVADLTAAICIIVLVVVVGYVTIKKHIARTRPARYGSSTGATPATIITPTPSPATPAAVVVATPTVVSPRKKIPWRRALTWALGTLLLVGMAVVAYHYWPQSTTPTTKTVPPSPTPTPDFGSLIFNTLFLLVGLGGIVLLGWTLLRLLKTMGKIWNLIPKKIIVSSVIVLTVLLTFYAIVFGAIVSSTHKIPPLFNTPEGWLDLFLYAFLAMLFTAVVKGVDGTWAKVSPIVLLLICYALIGPRTLMLLDPDGKIMKGMTSHFSGLNLGSATANNTCPGIKNPVTFGSQPIVINPDGRCGTDLWHEGHCLWLQRARWTNDVQAYRDCGGKGPRDVERAWSADQTFTGAVALVPPRYD